MLAADVPYFEVNGWVWRWKRDGSDVLADGRDGFEVRVRGCVCAFYLFQEGCFAGIVQAEEEDGVLWELLDGGRKRIAM
jgi:hypothetical protein